MCYIVNISKGKRSSINTNFLPDRRSGGCRMDNARGISQKKRKSGTEKMMSYDLGKHAEEMLSRQRGASVQELSEELGVSQRYAREIIAELGYFYDIYEKRGDFSYPRRKRYYLNTIDEFGRPLTLHLSRDEEDWIA